MSSSTVALVFSGGEVWNEDEPDGQANAILQELARSVPGPSSAEISESAQLAVDRNVNTYVRVFEDMVGTVMKEENHLLSDQEVGLLTLFAHLSYEARFLMVKLLLRKQDTWHRLDTLKYEGELGSTAAIVAAIDELCKVDPELLNVVKQELVDLTMNDSGANLQQAEDKPAPVDGRSPELVEDIPPAFARSDRDMDLKSLLECLRVDELKAIAKQLKLRPKQKKDDLIKDLLSTSSSQSTLSFARSGPKGRAYTPSKLSFCKLQPQQDRLRQIALAYIVRCIRVDEEFFGVIHRVNLVYFRLTQYTPGILVAALLTRFGKRAYSTYEYQRTKNIWSSRQALVDYEEVLILEGQVDTLLAGNVPSRGGRAAGSKTPVPRILLTPITPGNANDNKERGDVGGEDTVSDIRPDNDRRRGARMVKEMLEQIYPRWQHLVKTEGADDGRAGGLERFHCGHVFTRIVCKGCAALGILGEYERELEVLDALLSQKRWRKGQRGRWYERRALILSSHRPDHERALDTVIEALKDSDTHLVYRPKLQKRLKKLENKLKIPIEDRHTCDGILVNADEVVFEAVRLRHRAASLQLDRTGRCIDSSPQGNQDIKRYYSPVSVKADPGLTAGPSSDRKPSPDAPKGKSVWLGRDGGELAVEELALERYKEQGFKGVHCETRIIAMLFGLLFWDVIFESIPGAFETPYQTAPLDIAEDSFFHARKDLMERRLAAIDAGKGADLVQRVDAEHRSSGTWCVGVRWDLFSTEDLVDIVTCIGGKALSVICRVLCENYTFGTSGGPDLFLWNADKGTCKFVEVKGPGDSLQENQRIWIDILLKAPVDVEICRIVESGDDTDQKPDTRTPKSTRKNKKAKKISRKEERMSVDSEDADALPNVNGSEEQPVANGLRSSLSPGDTVAITEGTSSPLKRKAGSREVLSPTPSKRQRK